MVFRLIGVLSLLVLVACGAPVSHPPDTRILVMGDSLMAANTGTGQAVADVLAVKLKEPVANRAVPGARFLHFLPISGAAGFKIPSQYVDGPWDWVVMNGYGNDILLGCGCRACERQMDRLIDKGAVEGAIVDFLRGLRQDGARVIYTGYLRTPGVRAPVERCGVIGDEMDRRIARFAGRDAGLFFVNLSDIVPYGDKSYHAFDLVHPSPKGSAAIANRIAEVIRRNR